MTFEHEPVQNGAQVKVTGWLIWTKTKTRTPFVGTFDPVKELAEFKFEVESLPELEFSARLELSADGDRLSGHFTVSSPLTVEGEAIHRWELVRKPRLPEAPAADPEPRTE